MKKRLAFPICACYYVHRKTNTDFRKKRHAKARAVPQHSARFSERIQIVMEGNKMKYIAFDDKRPFDLILLGRVAIDFIDYICLC